MGVSSTSDVEVMAVAVLLFGHVDGDGFGDVLAKADPRSRFGGLTRG
jgi:hypothetical protein